MDIKERLKLHIPKEYVQVFLGNQTKKSIRLRNIALDIKGICTGSK